MSVFGLSCIDILNFNQNLAQMQRTITVEIHVGDVKNSYSLTVPTVGQLIQIESRKISLSLSSYSILMRSNAFLAQHALDLIDMIAFYEALCPELIKDLKVPLTELDIFDAKILLDGYIAKVTPWIVEWQQVLQGKVTKNESV